MLKPIMGPSRVPCHYTKGSYLFQLAITSITFKATVLVALKWKFFECILHGLLDLLGYYDDKPSCHITKVIFGAVVNPSTTITTTTQTPAENSQGTNSIKGHLFAFILAALCICFGAISLNLIRWSSKVSMGVT